MKALAFVALAALGCNGGLGSQPVVVRGGRQVAPRPEPAVRVKALPVGAALHTASAAASPLLSNSVLDARILVITADGTDSALGAIRSTLQFLGTPFDVLDATHDPPLTADRLASGTHGKYQAIFLDLGNLEVSGGGSAFTDAEWGVLESYEEQFGVRRVALYTSPSSAYGLTLVGQVDPTKTPVSMTCTPAGAAVFVGTNCAGTIVMSDGWAYPAQAADAQTTPLLVDASGNVYAAIRTYPDGREALALTFAQATYLTTTLQLAYGLVQWATRGLFIGERHVYAVPQIDDLFLASDIVTGGTYRINDVDLQALADWQGGARTQPLTGDLRLAWAANGYGSQSMPGDPLTAKAVALGPAFAWINHSWDHPILDNIGYADVLAEFTHNDTYLRGLGLTPYASINAVTPNISGLGSADAMQGLHDAGIRQIVGDTSIPGEDNQSPNVGRWNPLQPSILELPRVPGNIGYDTSQPAELIVEYETNVTKGATVDYPTVIDQTSTALLQQLLNGSNNPWMFHQANTRDYDGRGHSLMSDLLDATFAKYRAAATFPVLSPVMEDLAQRVEDRLKRESAGVSGTIQAGTITLSAASMATVPVTGLCTPGAETYGGQTISYVALAAGQTASYALSGCNGASGGAGGSAGAGGGGGGVAAGGAGGAGGMAMTGQGGSGGAGGHVTPAATGGAGGAAGAGAMGGGAAGSPGGSGGGSGGTAGMPGGAGAPGAAGMSGSAGAPGVAGMSGGAGAPGAAGTPGGGGAPGAAGAPGAGGEAGAPSAGQSGGGCDCAIGRGPSAGSSSWLLLAGVLVFVRRRGGAARFRSAR